MNRIRVLVVDDSPFMRRTIEKTLAAAPEIEIVGMAENGGTGVEMAKRLAPDVVTMDVNMPEMNGIEATRRIMAESPRPVVMLSAYTQEGARQTMDALAAGAVDFVSKPSHEKALDLAVIGEELIEKIRAAAHVGIRRLVEIDRSVVAPRHDDRLAAAAAGEMRLVVIGSSTGGPITLNRLFRRLPKNLPAAVLIAQHMPPRYTAGLAEQLNELGVLEVKEAVRGDLAAPGQALIAPGGYHMEVQKTGSIRIHQRDEKTAFVPSVDVLFRSAARNHGSRVIGVVLTGMGGDGAEGIREIKAHGGATLAQDEKTSVVYGMPRVAAETGCIDRIVPIDEMAEAIVDLLRAAPSKSAIPGTASNEGRRP
jgi:two-component system chemotaxis response regulator CheB